MTLTVTSHEPNLLRVLLVDDAAVVRRVVARARSNRRPAWNWPERRPTGGWPWP